jgi:hypothetical protein
MNTAKIADAINEADKVAIGETVNRRAVETMRIKKSCWRKIRVYVRFLVFKML